MTSPAQLILDIVPIDTKSSASPSAVSLSLRSGSESQGIFRTIREFTAFVTYGLLYSGRGIPGMSSPVPSGLKRFGSTVGPMTLPVRPSMLSLVCYCSGVLSPGVRMLSRLGGLV